MSYINDALLNTNHQRKLKEETKGLVDKWDKTGLLEGLSSDYDKSGMATILENQAKQLIDEASKTGTGGNNEEWAGVALPLVRRIFAEIAAQDFVSVQPMNLPSGLVFYLDFKYGTQKGGSPGKGTGDSVYGKTGPFSPLTAGGNNPTENTGTFPDGGFYGAGQYAYTQPSRSVSFGNVTITDASLSDLNYDTELSKSKAGKLYKIVNDAAVATVRADQQAVRAWKLRDPGDDVAGTVVSGSYPQFTTSGSDGIVSFIVESTDSATLEEGETAWTLEYLEQPIDSNRGDFEADAGSGPPETDVNIPEVNLDLKSSTIVAKTRKLKAVWTPELAQDLNAYHSVDAEAELTSMLSEYISMEIDLEIIDMLISDAVTTDYWSARVGYEWDSSASNFSANLQATNALAYQKNTWYQTLGQKIQKVSNKIHQLTLRGGANFLVCSPTVATLIESIPGYAPDTDGTKDQFAMGVSSIGALKSRWTVYKNPYMTENTILIGFRGSNFLETGAVYAPYIPLIMTPLVYDPTNFTPRKGVMTRYAKKMVRPEFYGKIFVHGLETV
tara:strand:+ start:12024 stop:13691 length:1668 start_codon:yes stop_codon:yes gene_type:complete